MSREIDPLGGSPVIFVLAFAPFAVMLAWIARVRLSRGSPAMTALVTVIPRPMAAPPSPRRCVQGRLARNAPGDRTKTGSASFLRTSSRIEASKVPTTPMAQTAVIQPGIPW